MKEPREKQRRRWSLLAVQGVLCGVILLVVLLWRLVGGSSYDVLRSTFRALLTDDGLAAVLTDA